MKEFLGSKIPNYAILSHTWGEGEVSFQEFTTDLAAATLKEGFRKIEYTCDQALADHLEYAWVDTCCIDKSSSAELSEAINSMFKWYERAMICYVYLSDVGIHFKEHQFPLSRWFRRGWTLQELIAPSDLIFFDYMWEKLGSKLEYAREICNITKVDEEVLNHLTIGEHRKRQQLEKFCIAKRMAWASRRETTRVEDMAYCLLGIFDVNMPLLYGEGEKAFVRLQLEIIKAMDDDSILAWGLVSDNAGAGMPSYVSNSVAVEPQLGALLAGSPRDFSNCHDLKHAAISISPFAMTNQGVQMELPLVQIDPGPGLAANHDPRGWVGLLTCSTSDMSELLGIVLTPSGTHANNMDRVVVQVPTRDYPIPGMTVVVGPRVATQAVPTKITISSMDSKAPSRQFSFYRQMVLYQSPRFQTFGYTVKNATRSAVWQYTVQHDPSAVWNSSSDVLTIRDDDSTVGLIIFTLTNRDERRYPTFSVLIRDDVAIARMGSDFSWVDHTYLSQILIRRDQESYSRDDVRLRSSDGRTYVIRLAIRNKVVHHWNIVEVFVDAVDADESPIST